MDTRQKIVPHLPADCDVVEGYFDPLLPSHVEQIAELKGSRPLAVLVREPDNPLMSSRARAELVAGLRDVDYVTIAGATTDGSTPDGRTLAEDRSELIRTIHEKHGR